MKPLALTVEEEAIIRRDLDVLGHLQQRRLCAEIDALRRLPVLPTCGDCGHCTRLYPQGAECWHPKSRASLHLHAAVDREAPPPLGSCPLRARRGAVSKQTEDECDLRAELRDVKAERDALEARAGVSPSARVEYHRVANIAAQRANELRDLRAAVLEVVLRMKIANSGPAVWDEAIDNWERALREAVEK